MSWAAPVALAGCTLALGLAAIVAESDLRAPGNNRGYEPVQPIAYSHRVHAGELGIECLHCHYAAESSRHAGIPPAEVCMECHAHVTAAFDAVLEERETAAAEGREPLRIVSPELRKLYDALGLDDDLRPDPTRERHPIRWVRVHRLPDHAYFDHRVHVARDLACEQCHGPVRSMERIRQDADLSMGWCLDCHRRTPATATAAPGSTEHVSIDCARCHY